MQAAWKKHQKWCWNAVGAKHIYVEYMNFEKKAVDLTLYLSEKKALAGICAIFLK